MHDVLGLCVCCVAPGCISLIIILQTNQVSVPDTPPTQGVLTCNYFFAPYMLCCWWWFWWTVFVTLIAAWCCVVVGFNGYTVNDATKLEALFMRGRFARVRARFPVPVILWGNKNICRSSTLSQKLEYMLQTAHNQVKNQLLSSGYVTPVLHLPLPLLFFFFFSPLTFM
jgi:hypothetical protein